MSSSHICQYCKQSFSRNDALIRHIKKKRCKWLKQTANLCEKIQTPVLEKDLIIPVMSREIEGEKTKSTKKKITTVSLIENMEQRLKKLEEQLTVKDKLISELKLNSFQKEISKQIEDFKEETKTKIQELGDKPLVNNQILQVVCLTNSDNYLDMLTDQWGNFDKALEYIKDCALSSLTGDCQLIEKIYLTETENPQVNIRFVDKSKTKIEYFNSEKKEVIDPRDIFGKKIANNLQNSYLKGVNHLITTNLENNRCPNKFLEEYDIQIWNQHIYDLSDIRYQKKIIGHLNIPVKR